MSMSLAVVAITHRTAPLTIRERLGFSPDDQVAWLREWKNLANEIVLLVTCHRTELYWIADEPGTGRGLEWLAAAAGLPVEVLAPVALRAEGEQAVRHLMRVAAGLDSRVVGETQILGQVRRAREFARTAGTLGPVLERLFSLSLAAGRTARARSGLGAGGRSLVRLAVGAVSRSLGGLGGRTVLVLGAGEMGRLVVTELRRERPAALWVSNRTAERLQALVRDGDVQGVEWARWPELVVEVDAIFVATAAPEPILCARHFDSRARSGVVVDLAVPRNVEPSVAHVPGIRLITVDDLQDEPESSLTQSPYQCAEEIVDHYVRRYLRWWQARQLAEEIRLAQEVLEQLCQRELRRAVQLIARNPEKASEIEREAAASIARKVLAPAFQSLHPETDGAAAVFRLLAGVQQ